MMRINDVRSAHLQRSLNKFDGKSASGATKYRMVLKQIFYRAFRNKLIIDDPSLDLIIPEGTTEGTHRVLEHWEIRLIADNWNRHIHGLWFLLLLCTGMRRGEMVVLTWDKIDLTNSSIIIDSSASFLTSNSPKIRSDTKTEAGDRVVPVPAILLKALALVQNECRTGYVCTTTGKPITETILRRNLRNFCKVMEQIKNGHPVDPNRQHTTKERLIKEFNNEPDQKFVPFSFRPHDLRHTYATALYDAGVDIKTAQYLLGHSDIKTTLNLYMHLSKQRKDAAVNDLKSHFDRMGLHQQISISGSQSVVNINEVVNKYLIESV